MKNQIFLAANKLFTRCYPIYYPLYFAWKTVSDRQSFTVLRRVVKPGMTVVDVGANIGFYTRVLADLTGKIGQVHAFEPDPLNYKHLCENVVSMSHIFLNQSAVGGQTGTIKLYLSDDFNIDHRTFDSKDGRRSIEVPLISIDEYFAPGQRVDFIKIDVQGAEFDVLRGARRVIHENCDVKILMEFWPYGLKKAGVAPGALMELIKSFDFEIKEVADMNGRVHSLTELNAEHIGHDCNLLIAKCSSASG